MDNNKLAKAYVALRNARSAATKEYEKKDAEFKEKLKALEGVMLTILNSGKTNSIATDNGTFYKQKDIIPSASDWDAFYEWMAEEKAFDALERRIKKSFIAEYMEANEGAKPPGVTTYEEWVVRVRKNSSD